MLLQCWQICIGMIQPKSYVCSGQLCYTQRHDVSVVGTFNWLVPLVTDLLHRSSLVQIHMRVLLVGRSRTITISSSLLLTGLHRYYVYVSIILASQHGCLLLLPTSVVSGSGMRPSELVPPLLSPDLTDARSDRENCENVTSLDRRAASRPRSPDLLSIFDIHIYIFIYLGITVRTVDSTDSNNNICHNFTKLQNNHKNGFI